MTRTVAVTGATGFIGRHVTADLLARGFAVRAIVRPESRHRAPAGAVPVPVSLDDTALTEAFSGVDVVVHLAGVVSALDVKTYATVNVEGTRAVTRAAQAAGARLIHVSSLAAAGPAPARAPRREDDPSIPQTPYGHSKLESEQVVMAAPDLRWLILRPGVVYGPGDRALLPLFKLAERGLLPLVGRADTAYTFVHVRDVVRTIGAAVDAAAVGEILFVGHADPVRPRELLEAIRTVIGRQAMVVPVPQTITRLAAGACDLVARVVGRPLPLSRWRYIEMSAPGFVCDVGRLRDRLGIVAEIDLRAGLADTAAWYRRAGWIRP